MKGDLLIGPFPERVISEWKALQVQIGTYRTRMDGVYSRLRFLFKAALHALQLEHHHFIFADSTNSAFHNDTI